MGRNDVISEQQKYLVRTWTVQTGALVKEVEKE